MHKLYDLKDQLVEELEKYGEKSDIPKSEIPYIDTLAHACKNICKIIEACEEEEEYSSRSMRGMPRRMSRRSDPMYDSSYDDGMSGRRDNRGRFMTAERGRAYSSGTEAEVKRLMDEAEDDRTRRALQQALQTIRG